MDEVVAPMIYEGTTDSVLFEQKFWAWLKANLRRILPKFNSLDDARIGCFLIYMTNFYQHRHKIYITAQSPSPFPLSFAL